MPQQNPVIGTGGSIYPDVGKLVKAMTEKPFFDLPLGSKMVPSSGRLLLLRHGHMVFVTLCFSFSVSVVKNLIVLFRYICFRKRE